MSSKNPIFIVVILATLSSDFTVGLTKDDRANDNFEFTRVEPGNELGITTKVIAHIHRPAKKITETWRLNREFTPEQVMKTLYDMCSDEPIVHVESEIKWNNCAISNEGLTAELTHGTPESRNKTLTYLAMTYKPFTRTLKGKQQMCTLALIEENPSYFMIETFSKLPSNDTFPRTPQESVDAVHLHRLGKFGKEFLRIYGDSIDQDGIYNFDGEDFLDRNQLYGCFLSIGSSESVTVIEDKCPVYCLQESNADELDLDSNELPKDAKTGKYKIWKNVGGPSPFREDYQGKKKESEEQERSHLHHEL